MARACGLARGRLPRADQTDPLTLIAPAIEESVLWTGQADLLEPRPQRPTPAVETHVDVVERQPKRRGDPVAGLVE